MKKLHLEIITPEKIIFTDEVDTVIIPTTLGDVGILPDHTPLFSKIIPGEIMVRKDNRQYFLAVTGGFLEVLENNVNVLAEYAVRAEDIEAVKVEEAKKRAEKLMSEKITQREFVLAQAELQKALLELKVVRKRRKL